MRAATVLALAAALGGCKDQAKPTPPAGTAALDSARMATLEAIAAMPNMPKTVRFRGVQAYAQSAPKRTAVCGLVSAFADDPNIFVPFVTVARDTSPADAATPRFEFDTHVGTTTSEATRVYSALVANCWDRGGPAPGQPPALPPLPDNIADPRIPPADAAPLPAVAAGPPKPAPARGQISADGTATVRQSANVHASPGGPNVRTVPQGMTLHIFATASGGWYQVGDTAPFGWVHESMLNR